MTDAARPPAEAAPRADDERLLGFVVYGLYLVSLFVMVVPAVVGLAVAYARRGNASPALRSHFSHQIRTFWIVTLLGLLSLGLAIAAGVTGAVDLFQVSTGGHRLDAWDALAWSSGDSTLVITPAAIALGIAAALAATASFLWLLVATVFGLARLASEQPVGHSPA